MRSTTIPSSFRDKDSNRRAGAIWAREIKSPEKSCRICRLHGPEDWQILRFVPVSDKMISVPRAAIGRAIGACATHELDAIGDALRAWLEL